MILFLFRVNNSENVGLKETGEQTNYSQLICCHSLSSAFEFNILDWSLDNKLLTLDLESKSRGTLEDQS